jgi:type II secretory pathway pseudopilin PulG
MDMTPSTGMPRGFLLPVLLLVLSLCGVLALSMVASATLDTRASQAAWFRRVALEAAEDTLAYAIREAPARTAPWEANWTTRHGVKVWLQVRPLGQWATAAAASGPSAIERHERAIALARAGRGAAVQLEQDFAYLPGNGTSLPSTAQRTVWRSVEVAP